MAGLIRVINLDYSQVKKSYKLYLRAKKTGPVEAERSAKKMVLDKQAISRLGNDITFPATMRPLIERECEKLDEDTYVADANTLQKITDALGSARDV